MKQRSVHRSEASLTGPPLRGIYSPEQQGIYTGNFNALCIEFSRLIKVSVR